MKVKNGYAIGALLVAIQGSENELKEATETLQKILKDPTPMELVLLMDVLAKVGATLSTLVKLKAGVDVKIVPLPELVKPNIDNDVANKIIESLELADETYERIFGEESEDESEENGNK